MARTVVTKTRTHGERKIQDFTFNHEMIPLNTDSPEFVRRYREQAWQDFQNFSMPTTSDEPWRRTDIRKLKADTFRLPDNGEVSGLPTIPDELLQPLVGDQHAGQIILEQAGSRSNIDNALKDRGVIFTDLKSAEREFPQILEYILGKIVKSDEGKFAALAAAFAENGVLVYVPKGVEVERPLHSILWGPGIGLAYFSHILI